MRALPLIVVPETTCSVSNVEVLPDASVIVPVHTPCSALVTASELLLLPPPPHPERDTTRSTKQSRSVRLPIDILMKS